MNIALYSPYIPEHTGGGEKYLLDVARVLVRLGHKVSVAVRGEHVLTAQLRQKYERFLGESLEGIHFVPTPVGTTASAWQKLAWTRQFDVMYYQTDGSFFFSLAKKNIVHFQVPLHLHRPSLLERLKIANWPVRNANSAFTRKIIEKSWAVNVPYVHYPMVELPDQALSELLAKKKHVILNVGRFFRHLHSKRQDVLVDAFRALCTASPEVKNEWQLVLIGAVEDEAYAAEVRAAAADLPITFIHDADRPTVTEWYAKAEIYWHATGFDVDEWSHPDKVEHFGISTVEAMGYGCVPVVVGKGGQVEVVGKALAGQTWQHVAECVDHTIALVRSKSVRKKYATLAYEQAHHFGPARFTKMLQEMIGHE